MNVIHEKMERTASFIISEGDASYSRDEVQIKSGAGKLMPGTVLGQVSATGLFKALDVSASDGSEMAAAVLFGACDAQSASARVVVISRHAQLASALLIWPEGITEDQQKTATTQLATLGLVVR